MRVSFDCYITTDRRREIVPSISHNAEAKPISLPGIEEKELMGRLDDVTQFRSGLLAPALRYLSEDRCVAVFERPPAMQYISYFPVAKDAIAKGLASLEHVLPIPWTIYIVYFDSTYTPYQVRTYVRGEPLSSLDDELYLLPMLNFYFNAKLCNPTFERFEANESTLAAGFEQAYNQVWNSGFNFDLLDALSVGQEFGSPVSMRRQGGTTTWVYNFFKEWSQLSLADVMKATWPRPGMAATGGYNSYPSQFRLKQAIEVVRHDSEDALNIGPAEKLIVDIVNAIT